MTRILSLLLMCAALAMVAAGCGGNDEQSAGGGAQTTATQTQTQTETSGGEAASGKGVEIAMRNIAFDPKDVTVKVGQKLEWENYDSVDHNVVAQEGADFKSKDFGKGEKFELTADKAGTITYVCTLHPGMEGTINVTQ